MESKICFKCNIDKPLSEYYKQKQMRDGHLNKCKDCTLKDVKAHRQSNIEKIREYDRNRSNAKERTEVDKKRRLNLKVNNPEKYRKQESKRGEWRDRNPEKYKAQTAVNNAVRDGRLEKPKSCSGCNEERRLHGHHDDYSKPLEVKWMCIVCHNQFHKNLDDRRRKP